MVEATLPRPTRAARTPRTHQRPARPASTDGAQGPRRLVVTHVSDLIQRDVGARRGRGRLGGPVNDRRRGRRLRGVVGPHVGTLVDACRQSEICSRNSSGCAGRWTSSSATSSAVATRRGGFSRGGRPVRRDPPRSVVQAELAGIDRRRARGRGPRPHPLRPAQATRRRGRVYQQLEIDYGRFQRVIALGVEVDPDAAAPATRTGSCASSCRSCSPRPQPHRAHRAVDEDPDVDRHRPAGDEATVDDGPPAARAARSCRCGRRCPSRTR